MEKVNLAQKLRLFQEHWKPKIVGELNGQMVKLVKFRVHLSGITTSLKMRWSWWSGDGFEWSFAIVRYGWRKANFSLCRRGSTTVL